MTIFIKQILKDKKNYSVEQTSEIFRAYLTELSAKYGYSTAFIVDDDTLNYYTEWGYIKTLDISNADDNWYIPFKNSKKYYELNIDNDQANNDRLTIYVNLKIKDDEEIKRVELHAHTKMSALDSVMDIENYVQTAKAYGHKAVAVTDHANCHVLPDLFEECKKAGIKPIAGVEGYYVDDSLYQIALTDESIDLHNATYVVFDFETTGFSINFNEIIEIGAGTGRYSVKLGQEGYDITALELVEANLEVMKKNIGFLIIKK